MNEDRLVYCPSCGEPRLKRLVSAPSFRLKGQGWYETDFKKGNQRNLLRSDAERQKGDKADAKSGKDDSSKSEEAGKKPTKSKKSSDKKAGGKVDSA
jgi:predicted nucleic acid-binding Zn ribbon protein